MPTDQHEEAIPQGQLWVAQNYQRIRLLAGVLMVPLGIWGLALGFSLEAYATSALNGLLGLLGIWLLGGWPAVKRLVRNPRMQLRHWYHVLVDARRVDHRYDEPVVMGPTLKDGWYWRSLRWYGK